MANWRKPTLLNGLIGCLSALPMGYGAHWVYHAMTDWYDDATMGQAWQKLNWAAGLTSHPLQVALRFIDPSQLVWQGALGWVC